jgi:hypothetical protein
MERRWQIRRHRLQTILFLNFVVNFVAALPSALAQQAATPTLDEILLRLENNLDHYDKQVPNFFCSEHIVSSLIYAKKHQYTVTDSVFRVTRNLSGTLIEEHEIKAVNGSPASGEHVGGPVSLGGVFSGGLDAVSLRQKICMSYALLPIQPGHSDEPHVIEFATLPDTKHWAGCVLKEEGTGRVFIDPVTMQVRRMELMAPRHSIVSEVGVWKISINYAPVSLGGQTFWMPASVTSTVTTASEGYVPAVYSFSARYSDYHKLEVTSHIVSPQ